MKANTNKNDADLLKRLDRLGQLLQNVGPEILGHRVLPNANGPSGKVLKFPSTC